MLATSGLERISRAFASSRAEGRLAIATYLTVGYPDRAATPALLRALVDGGADLVELGVPFSDPLADGTTVQRASEAALREGVTVADCVAEAAALVADRGVPTLLMGYANPFFRFGPSRLAAQGREAGIAGIIVPDLPPEEAGELDAALDAEGLARIDLVAPTTPDDRLERVLERARGFVYCVALTGVTGARGALAPELPGLLARIRARTDLPVVVGFGIAAAEHVRSLRGLADGVIVGSAVIDVVSRTAAGERERALRGFVGELRAAGRS